MRTLIGKVLILITNVLPLALRKRLAYLIANQVCCHQMLFVSPTVGLYLVEFTSTVRIIGDSAEAEQKERSIRS